MQPKLWTYYTGTGWHTIIQRDENVYGWSGMLRITPVDSWHGVATATWMKKHFSFWDPDSRPHYMWDGQKWVPDLRPGDSVRGEDVLIRPPLLLSSPVSVSGVGPHIGKDWHRADCFLTTTSTADGFWGLEETTQEIEPPKEPVFKRRYIKTVDVTDLYGRANHAQSWTYAQNIAGGSTSEIDVAKLREEYRKVWLYSREVPVCLDHGAVSLEHVIDRGAGKVLAKFYWVCGECEARR